MEEKNFTIETKSGLSQNWSKLNDNYILIINICDHNWIIVLNENLNVICLESIINEIFSYPGFDLNVNEENISKYLLSPISSIFGKKVGITFWKKKIVIPGEKFRRFFVPSKTTGLLVCHKVRSDNPQLPIKNSIPYSVLESKISDDLGHFRLKISDDPPIKISAMAFFESISRKK